MWYFQSNSDAGVPPASFFVDGSQGPPCDPKLISTDKQPTSVASRVASAAGRLCSNGITGMWDWAWSHARQNEGAVRRDDESSALKGGTRSSRYHRLDTLITLIFPPLLESQNAWVCFSIWYCLPVLIPAHGWLMAYPSDCEEFLRMTNYEAFSNSSSMRTEANFAVHFQ